MKLTFYGAAGEVGRSSVLVEGEGKNMLLDCGIKLGEVTEYPTMSEEEIKAIKNIFISHAHLDHSGYLPHIYAGGGRPNIYMTKPTRDLIGILLADYRRIHHSKHEQKLFAQRDVDNVIKAATAVEFGGLHKEPFEFSLHNAGHVLGSAMIRINKGGGLLYTGDICMRNTRILSACEKGIDAQTLIVENTYGGKEDIIPSFRESALKLAKSINEALGRGGHVIIPSFAVGRGQEILLMLDDYIKSGNLKGTKIYVEGMINKAMRIFRHNAYYASDEIKKRILMSEDDPFKSSFFYSSKKKDRSDVLSEPCVIVTTSGMLTGGPVHFYLEKLAHDPRNKIIFCGYQAEGTPGRKIVDGARKVVLNEGDENERKEVEINCEIEYIRISGHADYNELLQFVRSTKNLKRVFLMHGEKTDLKDALEKDYEVCMPKLGESFDI